MIRQIEVPQFLRNLKIYPNGQITIFLGSGASVQAGIPCGSALVWEFKKEIYCSITRTSIEKFRDLQSETNRSILQDFFDAEGDNPKRNDPSEYSHYFEKCYSSSDLRKQFIINLVRDIHPSLGHLCLGDLVINGKIKNIWTTNFDELIEAGIKHLNPAYSFRVYSSAINNRHDITVDSNFSNIFKLHGDYRYDRIKNTLEEVQSLELTMNNIFETSLTNGCLVMIGYSGCDESIMDALEKIIKIGGLRNGLIWLKRKFTELPSRTLELLRHVCEKNENSGIVEIDGFDEFMYSYYQICDGNNQLINERWRDFSARRLPITFSNPRTDYFIKMNAFESILYPVPYSFDTDIVTWEDLRKIVGKNEIVYALYARKIYCFGSMETIHKIFNNHILSDIQEEPVSQKFLYRDRSFYTFMLYDLMGISLTKNKSIKKFGKNMYYDSTKRETINENYTSYYVYDGINMALEYINGKYYLLITLTVYIVDAKGNSVPNGTKKLLINKKMSNVYNQNYNEKIKYWNSVFLNKNNLIEFSHDKFVLKFNHVCITYGKIPSDKNFPQRISYQFDEPIISFSVIDNSLKGVNQLNGITKYGPIDYSYAPKGQLRHLIKISIIAPTNDLPRIITHLAKLNTGCKMNKDDGFIPLYNGFESIYRQGLDIPQMDDNGRCLRYDGTKILSRDNLVNVLKSKIDFLSLTRHNFSILVIYIPKIFENYRMGNTEEDFNLHDAIKLYAMDKEIRVQFIEEKSINAYKPCKVMWALSASIYAKQGGVLWRPETLNLETAFVGISYAYSKEKGISVGCSQLFDSSGTGLRLLLRKIIDPQFINKSPFMKANEARKMMSTLREQYYNSSSASKLKRIVIHKTTFFTADEIQGFTQALEGIEDIELLQIQEFSPWRGIRFKNIDYNCGVYNFPIKRGTVVQLSDDQYLLWSHGCVINNEFHNGKGFNYYKGGRGIPIPLMIKRFYGKATGDTLTREIMMLTKMNWNSGDSLYKQLPVTLDFAKILSRMSKQNEALYDKLYDFRFFM